jgi:hypothetical protein
VPLLLLPALCSTADTLIFSSVAVVSIASLNLSLLVNPVGLYQVRIVCVCGGGGGGGGRGEEAAGQVSVLIARSNMPSYDSSSC